MNPMIPFIYPYNNTNPSNYEQNQIDKINNKLDRIEKNIRILENKVNKLENNNKINNHTINENPTDMYII